MCEFRGACCLAVRAGSAFGVATGEGNVMPLNGDAAGRPGEATPTTQALIIDKFAGRVGSVNGPIGQTDANLAGDIGVVNLFGQFFVERV